MNGAGRADGQMPHMRRRQMRHPKVQGLARRGGDVVLAVPPHARRLLALTGKKDAFWVDARVAAAVAGIASRRTRYAVRRPAVSAAGRGGQRRCVLVPGGRGPGRRRPWRAVCATGSADDR
jgi:hypothetical protein